MRRSILLICLVCFLTLCLATPAKKGRRKSNRRKQSSIQKSPQLEEQALAISKSESLDLSREENQDQSQNQDRDLEERIRREIEERQSREFEEGRQITYQALFNDLPVSAIDGIAADRAELASVVARFTLRTRLQTYLFHVNEYKGNTLVRKNACRSATEQKKGTFYVSCLLGSNWQNGNMGLPHR